MKLLIQFQHTTAKKYGYKDWNDIYLPNIKPDILVKIIIEASELYAQQFKDEIERLKIELSNYAYQIDRAKRDRDKAESESERLKEENERQQSEIKMLTGTLRSTHDEAQNWFNQNSELESELSKAKELLKLFYDRMLALHPASTATPMMKQAKELFLESSSTVKPEQTEEPKVTCFEIWRPNIPDNGCKTQCKECAEQEKLKVGEPEQTNQPEESQEPDYTNFTPNS